MQEVIEKTRDRMSKTYTATGINLKSVPFGENDRLLTILTPEFGLVRAVAPGARKHKSSLRGRSGLFVVNNLLIIRGRSLDKVIQADSITSFVNLSKDLGKLTAGQYLAELALFQALSQHPQDELYELICRSLAELEAEPSSATLATLVRSIYAMLAYGGLAPQVFRCCATQRAVQPDLNDSQWRVEFDTTAGGIVAPVSSKIEPRTDVGVSDRPVCPGFKAVSSLDSDSDRKLARNLYTEQDEGNEAGVNESLERADTELGYSSMTVVTDEQDYRAIVRSPASTYAGLSPVDVQSRHNQSQEDLSKNLSNVSHINRSSSRKIELTTQLTAAELAALQWIAQIDQQRETMQSLDAQQIEESPSEQIEGDRPISCQTWLSLERVLRHYAQYHFDQSIRSAALIEVCFLLPSPSR